MPLRPTCSPTSFFSCSGDHRDLHSFPTRRSSDLFRVGRNFFNTGTVNYFSTAGQASAGTNLDRKSTRLNSSHGYISYAVFCLKKKIEEEIGIVDTAVEGGIGEKCMLNIAGCTTYD